MNRIYSVLLMSVMVCVSGCEQSSPKPSNATEATEQLLNHSNWYRDSQPADWAGRVQELIEAGADVNSKDQYEYSPLHHACNIWTSKDPEVVRILIAAGSDVNAKDVYGKTPLHYACDIWTSYPEVIRMLIEAGADVTAMTPDGITPLLNRQEATKIVDSLKAASEETKKLLDACITGADTSYIYQLIRSGADLEGRGRFGNTPLINACMYNNASYEIINMLINEGADVNARNYVGLTALGMAFDSPPEIVALLIKSGADVNAKLGAGQTPLIRAAMFTWKHPENITLLIDAGADVNAKDNGGRTALYHASKSSEPESDEIKQLLIDAGAKE